MRILFITPECAPYAKTGGLGDVVAGLPKALVRLGHDVRIVLPLYRSIDRTKHEITPAGNACVHMANGEELWIGIHRCVRDGVPAWFVQYDRFFDRPYIYGDSSGAGSDDGWRFGLLCKAAFRLCMDRQWIPDVLHLHDWPAALGAYFLRTQSSEHFVGTGSILTIHNIGHQGLVDSSAIPFLGIKPEHYVGDIFENYGKLNLLKAGVHFADKITTVSPTHAKEILEPVGGHGLAPYLNNRGADVSGILNGVDREWNPSTDTFIPAQYGANDLSGKAVCKAALQQRFGLEENPSLPVFGIITRFAPQKGCDLMIDALPRALDSMLMQIVVLGSGEGYVEDFFRWLQSRYPGRVGSYIGYSNELSHWIEAGSDFFLMPSLYEPCGLNQVYSMLYGTLPIVRSTGGLADTVEHYNETTGAGTGFVFGPADATAFYYSIGLAVSTWFDRPNHIERMRGEGMRRDFSWEHSAREYIRLYESVIDRGSC